MKNRARFRKLADTWRRETAFLSSVTRMSAHPAYVEIIGMGQMAVPWILDELRERPAQWFTALMEITGEDPVPQSAAGDLYAMSNAWFAWERQGQLAEEEHLRLVEDACRASAKSLSAGWDNPLDAEYDELDD